MSTESHQAINEYPDPTDTDLNDPDFEAVWNAIKEWDLSRFRETKDGHRLYAGATGNDVMHILLALKHSDSQLPIQPPATDDKQWTHEKLQGLLQISHEDRYVADRAFENTLDEINTALDAEKEKFRKAKEWNQITEIEIKNLRSLYEETQVAIAIKHKALLGLVTEIRAYQSPECDDAGAIGQPELKEADEALSTGCIGVYLSALAAIEKKDRALNLVIDWFTPPNDSTTPFPSSQITSALDITVDLSALYKHDKKIRREALNEGLLGAFKSNNEHWNEGWEVCWRDKVKPLVDALERIREQVPHFEFALTIEGREIWLHDFVADALAKIK